MVKLAEITTVTYIVLQPEGEIKNRQNQSRLFWYLLFLNLVVKKKYYLGCLDIGMVHLSSRLPLYWIFCLIELKYISQRTVHNVGIKAFSVFQFLIHKFLLHSEWPKETQHERPSTSIRLDIGNERGIISFTYLDLDREFCTRSEGAHWSKNSEV